jgi:hypothetical protein
VVLAAASAAAASVEPVADIVKKSPYLAHCQSERAQRLEGLRKETQQHTPGKKIEAHRSRILEFKAVMNTIFKADKDTAQIIHVHKIVDFLYYQCYRDQLPERAAVTRKRCKVNLTAKIESTTGGVASMLKKEIATICVTLQDVKRKHKYDDLYGSYTSSGTADLFDHKDSKYVVENKRSQLKEGAISNPVGPTSFKNYHNSVIKILNYQVHLKKNNSACRYDDIKGNDSITQFLNLAKKQRTTIAKLSFDNKIKDEYRSFDLLNKVPDIEEKLWFCNTTKLRHSV